MTAVVRLCSVAVSLLVAAAGCAAQPESTASPTGHGPVMAEPSAQELSRVLLATASGQDVSSVEAQGYASTMATLGCFQDSTRGGMGLHFVNGSLLDDRLDAEHPEAYVYELSADGTVAGLVAVEYIVPVETWKGADAPHLFGMPYHRHATLPLWVLHLWAWKPNPSGVFADFNPAVRQCPAGVPIFGRDLPKPGKSPHGR